MQLSISNIAWNTKEDKIIAELLQRYQIRMIDIAPGKYFNHLPLVKISEIKNIRQWWDSYNIKIIGIQSLLFGTKGLNLFGDIGVRHRMLKHLMYVCHIGANLGATKLVFGSPKNRDCSGLSKNQIQDIAVEFFYRLGEIARTYGIIICLEPNPVCYGTNFMVNTEETAQIVNLVNHSSVKMQLDTGALIFNQENILSVLKKYVDIIGHIHISEPGLIPIGDSDSNHKIISDTLKEYCHDKVATIEMVATSEEPHSEAIKRALTFVREYYC